MTTTRKWTVGAALLVVVVFVGSWFLLVAPKRGEASQLEADAEAQTQKNASLTTDVQVLKAQNKDLPKYQAQLAELRNRIPSTSAMPGLVRQLNAAATKSGVDLQSLTPAPAVPLASADGVVPVPNTDGSLPPESLAGINMTIVVEGGYFEIQQFVNKVENLQRYVQVSTLTVSEPETESEEISDAGKLTATLESRAYLVPPLSAATVPTEEPSATTTEAP